MAAAAATTTAPTTATFLVPGRGVSNVFISDVLKRYCADFVGTFACDKIPVNRLSQLDRYSLVCNLSPAHLPGSHFVAVMVDERRIVFSDPLILPTRFLAGGIRRFLRSAAAAAVATDGGGSRGRKKRGRRRIVLKPPHRVQSTDSYFCGLFAMVYVMHFDSRVRGKPERLHFRPVREGNSDDGADNEELCVKYLTQMISACAAAR